MFRFIYPTQNKSTVLDDGQGFTLVEVMVAVSIFAIVITVGIGALLTVNSTFMLSRAQQKSINNAAFAFEKMSREIRTGSEYSDNVSNGMQFTNFEGKDVVYKLNDSNTSNDGCIQENVDNTGFQCLTSDDVTFNQLNFVVLGDGSGDAKQPIVFITAYGVSEVGKETESFTLQTAVTQRTLEVN